MEIQTNRKRGVLQPSGPFLRMVPAASTIRATSAGWVWAWGGGESEDGTDESGRERPKCLLSKVSGFYGEMVNLARRAWGQVTSVVRWFGGSRFACDRFEIGCVALLRSEDFPFFAAFRCFRSPNLLRCFRAAGNLSSFQNYVSRGSWGMVGGGRWPVATDSTIRLPPGSADG